MDLTNKQKENLKRLVFEMLAFSIEQLEAMDKLIPMTQEIFESILERCNELGPAADKTFYRILDEYPDLADVYADAIIAEANQHSKDIDFPEETPEERQAAWERLCARIREEFGEDAI